MATATALRPWRWGRIRLWRSKEASGLVDRHVLAGRCGSVARSDQHFVRRLPARTESATVAPEPSFAVPAPRFAMFIFVSHLSVPDTDHDELERHFRQRSRLVDDFPGFLYLQLLRPQAGVATHTFLTAWESREAFGRYMKSREHAHSHHREPAEIMGRTSVRHEAFEVLIDSREDPEWLPQT